MARTRWSSKFNTARPVGGSALTSSPLARATPSRSPKNSTWAAATLVTTPTSGRATRASSVMWPWPRAPISSTTHRASSEALSRVSGRPSSLLNDRSLAAVGKLEPRHAATRSLVVVLPTEPVMPTTPPTRARASSPRPMSARAVSPTTTAVPPTGPVAVEVRRRTGGERGPDEGMAVPLGHDGDEQLPWPDRPGVDAHSVDRDVGTDQLPPDMGRDLRGGKSHASPSQPIVASVDA